MKDNLDSKEISPLVTIYMPTYNRVELLQRAVESVLNQDYQNIELIVVDDKSTDSTHEYLEKIAKEDSRFKYFINEENSGACVSRNKAIFAANGEFITGLDDDDYFLPHHISSHLKVWKNKPEDCIAQYADVHRKSNNGLKKLPKKMTVCKSNDLICANWIGNQIFTKTSFLIAINGFDEKLPAWQDIECWYRLLDFYKSKAYSTKIHSYVVDISHPHERITTGKIDSIHEAYEYFCKKNGLTLNEKNIMMLQLNYYSEEMPNIYYIVKSLSHTRKLYNIRVSILRVVAPMIRRVRLNNRD